MRLTVNEHELWRLIDALERQEGETEFSRRLSAMLVA